MQLLVYSNTFQNFNYLRKSIFSYSIVNLKSHRVYIQLTCFTAIPAKSWFARARKHVKLGSGTASSVFTRPTFAFIEILSEAYAYHSNTKSTEPFRNTNYFIAEILIIAHFEHIIFFSRNFKGITVWILEHFAPPVLQSYA